MPYPEVQYEQLRPQQIVQRRQKCSLAWIPVGCLEYHGEYLPVGTDGLRAHELCQRAAVVAGGLVLPPVWYGEPRTFQLVDINGGIEQRQAIRKRFGPTTPSAFDSEPVRLELDHTIHTIHRVIMQCIQMGFDAAYLVIGHGPLWEYGRIVSRAIERRHPIRCHAELINYMLPDTTRPDHAGDIETWTTYELCKWVVPEDRTFEDTTGMAGKHPLDFEGEGATGFVWGKQTVQRFVDHMIEQAALLMARERDVGKLELT